MQASIRWLEQPDTAANSLIESDGPISGAARKAVAFHAIVATN